MARRVSADAVGRSLGGRRIDGGRRAGIQTEAPRADLGKERTSDNQEDTIRISIAISALALAGGFAGSAVPAVAAQPAGDDVAVCNEAENSPRGGYSVVGGIVDPDPPAFLRGSQMRVGNGHGAGLLNAARHSPALRECEPTDDGGGPQAS